MGMRAISVLIIIMSATTMGVWMDVSGFNDHMGVDPDLSLSDEVQQFDQSDSELTSRDAGVSDYLGFTVAAVEYFVVGVVLIGAFENSLYIIGFPQWVVFPVMNFMIRPIYFLALVQIVRGVVYE